MAVSLLPWITQYFPDSNGNPLAGGSIETFAAGTSTPKNTWSDPSGTVLNANPIPLGANGQPISGGIYGTIGEAYKIVVKNASGVVQPCSKDNVLFPATTSGGGGGGSYLDKVTTTPQSVASAVTWAELQSMSKGLSITSPDAGGWAMKIPDGSWISPQTAGQPLYLTSHTNPAPSGNGSVLHLTTTPMLALGDGTKMLGRVWVTGGYSELYSEAPSNGSFGRVEVVPASYSRMIHYDSASGQSASVQLRYDFAYLSAKGGQVRVVDGAGVQLIPTIGNYVQIQNLTTGTASGLLGYDASGNIIQAGSAPAGGFVALSGHNDLGTTPWSIADDTTFANSDAGIQFDPMGAYQAHLKGNLLIDQGVSNVLTLYRQAFAIGTTQDLIFGAQNSLGNATPYVHQHSYITANTSGAEEAEWRLQTRVAGAMVERIRANVSGGILSGDWSTTLNHKAKYFSSWATSGNGDWAIRDATDALNRFVIGKEPTTDNLEMYRYSDAGAYAGRVWNIDRQTGAVTYYSKGIFPASVATAASISLPTGVAVTSPVTGDMWSAAADQMQWRSGANTRRFGFLEVAQTWSAVQTFSSTPVISSTTASTTAGALYKRTNFGHVGYEAGMAQEFLSNVYTGPVGTALTNSTTETDVTGGTAVFGTRTTSTSVWQNGTTICGSTTALITNTASANTITFKVKYGATTVMTIVASVAIVATAQSIKIWFEGVATAAPGASVETIWIGGIEGGTILSLTSITNGATNVATNAATAVSMTAQWGTALATSTYHTKATKINLV